MEEVKEPIYILTDENDEEWFYGKMFPHWADTFFSNPTEETMAEFARSHNSKLFKQIA